MQEHFAEIYPESEAKIDECLYLTQKYVVRRWLLDEQKRVDGRGMDDMRPLAAEVALLPRVHGSGMFTGDRPRCSPWPPWALCGTTSS